MIWRFSVMSTYWLVSIWCCPTSVTMIASSNCSLIALKISSGPITPFGRIVSGCSFFQASICASHFDVEHGSTYSAIFVIASFASATIGISTWMFREIEAVSMSMWMICACGANSCSFPVIRSLKRVPMENSRSHSLTAIFAAYAPCMPRFPMNSGCFVEIAPRPITVVTTGTCVFSTTSRNTSCACAMLTPPPARNSGRFAFASIFSARFNWPMCTLVFGL